MNLILIGKQGSGKGTQAKILANDLGLAHISSGDLLRGIQGEIKMMIEKIMRKGELVPDEIVFEIIRQRISEADCKRGTIFDGFPRNLKQARMLSELIKIDKVIEIDISDSEAIRRLIGRMNCPNCGRMYNENTSPKPKKKETCDFCKTKLVRRSDDNEKSICQRLETYKRETKMILGVFDILKINGERSIEEISEDIKRCII